MQLWLIGYGAWPVATRARKLVEALRARGVTRLVDVRLNPCSSDLAAGRPYGPKLWNLQAGDAGLVALLAKAGIAYTWLVELGNPQRQDPAMAVLRAHLADPAGDWPVHRGLERLAAMLRAETDTLALLCACGDGRSCHRTVVAEAVRDRHFGGDLAIGEAADRRIRSDGTAAT
jgi:uncharacterized protein (DUF488 family)